MRELNRTLCVVLVTLTASVVAASALPVQQSESPPPLVKENDTRQVSDHVYVILDDNVRFVPNVGIIVGDRSTLVVDTGLGPRNAETILREVEKISSNETLYVVSTHFHPEHALGEAGFPETTTLLRSRAQQQDIDEFGLSVADRFAGFSAINAELLADVEFREADEVFEAERRLDLGGLEVQIFSLGPTHTRGDTMVFVPGDGVLFAGDVVMNRRFLAFNSPYSSVDAWLDSLAQLERLNPTQIVPSHGAMDDGSLIGQNQDYLAAIRSRVAELKAQGRSSEETIEMVRSEVQSAYSGWTGGADRISSAARIAYTEAN